MTKIEIYIRIKKSISTLMITVQLVFAHYFLLSKHELRQIIEPMTGRTNTNSTANWTRFTTEGNFILEVKKAGYKFLIQKKGKQVFKMNVQALEIAGNMLFF